MLVEMEGHCKYMITVILLNILEFQIMIFINYINILYKINNNYNKYINYEDV